MQASDVILVNRCLEGDSQAWEVIVRSYTGRLLNMGYQYLGSYAVAEELTQDIFLKVYQNLASFHPETGSLKSWIMRVGRNLIIDYYRSHKKEKNVAGSEELEVLDIKTSNKKATPFDNIYLREKAEFLYSLLEKISPELKEAVILRDIEELTYQEISERIEIPVGTVKSRINRGRIELSKKMSETRRDLVTT